MKTTKLRRPLLAGLLMMTFLMSAPLPAAADDGVLVTLQAAETSVSEILRILAGRSGVNIVTSPEVDNRFISIRITDTPFEEALNLVVRAAGLGYERVGRTILVAGVESLKIQTGLVTRVYDLEYADPAEVQAALEVVTSQVSIDPSHNRVVVHATQSDLEQVEHVIAQLDHKPKQVLLEARLIEVNVSELSERGIDWEKLTKWSTLLTEGYHGMGEAGALPVDIDYTDFTDVSSIYRQSATFELAIDELITEGHARMLSNTKVVTVDGESAEIFAGETVPVVITSLSSPGASGGTLQTIQLEKIDVGVRLNITPRVTSDGMVTTLVEPEVSRILRFVGPDEDLPQTSTRRASTSVRVRDGQTIFLGGLLSEEVRRTVKKVPLLGDIPLLGALFRHTSDEKVNLDLVIEITPRIISDSGEGLPTARSESPKLFEDAANPVEGPPPAAGRN
jgi:type II secretory pathway component GspD/PulD (secretin)